MLDDPLQMADPRRRFTENPYERGRGRPDLHPVSATCSAASPTEPHEKPGEEFAKGHYEQLIAGTGSIGVGDEEWAHRRLRPARPLVGPALLAGAVVLPLAHRQRRRRLRLHGEPHRPAATARARGAASCGTASSCTSAATSRSRPSGPRRGTYHQSIAATLRRDEERRGGSPARWRHDPPAQPRRPDGDGSVTRIGEGLTQWTLDDGRVGYGLSEYLDQIIDDQPVGLAE